MTVIASLRNLSRTYLCNGYVRRSILNRFVSTKPVNTEDDDDKPYAFLGTEAATWKASQTDDSNYLWYKPHVISLSIAVFLIYFCILREENDVDRIFDRSLYDYMPDLEKERLLQTHYHNLQNGQSVDNIEKRLKEILIMERQNKDQ